VKALRAAVYLRVSSENQAEKRTIANQAHDLPAIARRQGWKLAGDYTDEARSAKAGMLEHRTGFARLVADMQKRPRPFDIVVVADLDRLTRSIDIQERGQILGAFQKTGVLIYDAMKGQLLDLATSTGDLMAVLGTWFAAEDNRKRSERTRSGQRRAAREGRKPMGRTPFGLAWDRAAGWSVDPVLGPVVEEIFRRVTGGESLVQIARDLHARGVPTNAVLAGKQGRWRACRVWAIVRNPGLYADGEWVAIKSEGSVVKVPTIVTRGQADAADRALASHGRRNKSRQRQDYLCQGILRCGLCGANVAATYVKPQKKIHRYYQCARRRRPPVGTKPCTLPILRADDVDERVWAALVDVLQKPEYIRGALAEQDASAGDQETFAKDLEEAEAKLAAYDKRCARIAEDYRSGRVAEPVWEDHLAAIPRERQARLRQVEAARAGIDLATARSAQVTDIVEGAKRLQRRLKGADFATRRELVQALIPGGRHAATVEPDGKLHLSVVFSSSPVFASSRRSSTRTDARAGRT
jgi:site-specific DNA recombinase